MSAGKEAPKSNDHLNPTKRQNLKVGIPHFDKATAKARDYDDNTQEQTSAVLRSNYSQVLGTARCTFALYDGGSLAYERESVNETEIFVCWSREPFSGSVNETEIFVGEFHGTFSESANETEIFVGEFQGIFEEIAKKIAVEIGRKLADHG